MFILQIWEDELTKIACHVLRTKIPFINTTCQKCQANATYQTCAMCQTHKICGKCHNTHSINDINKMKHDFQNSQKTKQEIKCLFSFQVKKEFGHISTTYPMYLAKLCSCEAIDIAENMTEILRTYYVIANVQVAKNGFINIIFRDSYLLFFAIDSCRIGANNFKDFALSDIRPKQQIGDITVRHANDNYPLKNPINVEFLSANPTGDLHIGHARQAIFGNTIANILRYVGYDVTKEYYINNYGNQAHMFAQSVYYQYCKICAAPEPFPFNGDMYKGKYIHDIATILFDQYNEQLLDSYEKHASLIRHLSIDIIMNKINQDLTNMNIMYDVYTKESEIVKAMPELIEILQKRNLISYVQLALPKNEIYQKEKFNQEQNKTSHQPVTMSNHSAINDHLTLVYKTNHQSEPMALQRKDGTWTYFAGDIGYYSDKVLRGYNTIVCIFGYDHKDHQKKIQIVSQDLQGPDIIFVTCQLVRFLDTETQQTYIMSKRSGNFISLSDIIKQIPADLLKLHLLSREYDHEIVIDPQQISQLNDNNIYYYIQYAHARIHSIKAKTSHKSIIDMLDVLLRLYTTITEQTTTQIAQEDLQKQTCSSFVTSALSDSDKLQFSQQLTSLLENIVHQLSISKTLNNYISSAQQYCQTLGDDLAINNPCFTNNFHCNNVNKKFAQQTSLAFLDIKLLDEEISIILLILNFPRIFYSSLTTLSPNVIISYLQNLTKAFHSWWNLGTINADDKMLTNNPIKQNYRLIILQQTQKIIQECLYLFGVKPLNNL